MTELTVMPPELEPGDVILKWIGWGDEPVDVTNAIGDWTIECVIVRPEDAPSYRRHKHGTVQVLLDGGLSYIEMPEDAQVLVHREEIES